MAVTRHHCTRLVCCLAVGAGGCRYQVSSPPARMVLLESARTAAPGEMMATGRSAYHTAIFEPGVATFSAGLRRGLGPKLEVDGEGTYARLLWEDDDNTRRLTKDLYAARAGLKWAPLTELALVTGLGGGYAPAAGSFVSADVGFIASVDNCYVRPLLSVMAFGSQPLVAKIVDFRDEGHSQADTTVGWGAALGVEVPLEWRRCRRGLTPARLQLGLHASSLYRLSDATTTDEDGTVRRESVGYGSFGPAFGVEFPF
jgi:hypothetical protein